MSLVFFNFCPSDRLYFFNKCPSAGFLVRAGAGPCLVRFPLVILQYSPNVSQYSPGARENNYCFARFPAGISGTVVTEVWHGLFGRAYLELS